MHGGMPHGNRPEMPNGEQPPQDGMPPEAPEGQERHGQQNGESPRMPNSEPPEIPDGERPEMPDGMTLPDNMDGIMGGHMMPNGETSTTFVISMGGNQFTNVSPVEWKIKEILQKVDTVEFLFLRLVGGFLI